MENSNEIKNTLGEKVKYFRQRKNYSIEKISEETGIPIRFIEKLENGEKENAILLLIEKIACALDVNSNDLVDRKIIYYNKE